jgi:hypothetical protein
MFSYGVMVVRSLLCFALLPSFSSGALLFAWGFFGICKLQMYVVRHKVLVRN